MQEGTLAKWSAAEGDAIAVGQEIMDIETSKIANVFESPVEGTLRKRVAQDGEVLPVGALLAAWERALGNKFTGDPSISIVPESGRTRPERSVSPASRTMSGQVCRMDRIIPASATHSNSRGIPSSARFPWRGL